MIAVAGGIILAVLFFVLLPWIWTAISFAFVTILAIALIAGLCLAQYVILQDGKFFAVELGVIALVSVWWYYESKVPRLPP
jgi:hypothetical protein